MILLDSIHINHYNGAVFALWNWDNVDGAS